MGEEKVLLASWQETERDQRWREGDRFFQATPAVTTSPDQASPSRTIFRIKFSADKSTDEYHDPMT